MNGSSFVRRLVYLFRTFILIGSTSFGGYMSLVAMMRERMVTRDKIIDDNYITEGITLASMLPGPVAVNVVAYTGFRLAGVGGALISICAVLIPSFIFVVILSILYISFSENFNFEGILRGVFPVVAAIILATAIGMGKRACKNRVHFVLAGLSFIILFFVKGYWIILLLLVCSAVTGIFLLREEPVERVRSKQSWRTVLISLALYAIVIAIGIALTYQTTLGKLIAEFTQISLTLFGGGYVMVPILKTRFVEQLQWVSEQEFIYGISIGQVTPGPILTSAAFFGYKMAGFAGALAATLAIYMPSSMLMIVCSNLIHPLRGHRFFQAALSGMKSAIVGIILYSAVVIFMTNETETNWVISTLLATITFWLSFRYNVISAALIVAGGLIGFFIYQ